MAAAKSLERLLRIFGLEEELHHRDLESAQREQASIARALDGAREQERRGRRLTIHGVECDELPDRLAGIEEVQAGKRRAMELELRMAQISQRVEELRVAYLEKRVERRQAETLVNNANEREAVEADRKAQQSLDDWYLTRVPVKNLAQGQDERSAKSEILDNEPE
jgi:hypothetical protein